MNELKQGTQILAANGQAFTVNADLARVFRPGDRLVADSQAGILHIPAAELRTATLAVDAAAAAFSDMAGVADEAIIAFYNRVASALADDAVWNAVATFNAEDVENARRRGRSTTRLAVSESMRGKMIDGLRGWASTPSRRGAVLDTVRHDGFRVDLVGAALGVVAFVFEGRPNVLADACGVLRGGNTVVFRIGRDALGTARAIMELAIQPALARAGLPAGAVSLVDSTAHASGWALFLDPRLALAVARGSGPAVATLGALARSAGTPVSLHGTGGAWMVVSDNVGEDAVEEAVLRSLDRKVCNTLNTCCLVNGEGRQRQADAVLQGLQRAGEARGCAFKVHVAKGSEGLVPEAMYARKVEVIRAEGPVREPQVEPLERAELGTEWEWEDTPEVSIVGVDTIDEAVRLFNDLSPRLVGTLLSNDAAEHERFFATLDSPFVGDNHTRWVDGQFALGKPELGLSNWQHGRLFGRGGVLTGDDVYTVRLRYRSESTGPRSEAQPEE
ncbi:MAG: aldehyde dehydrogenase family protein [Gammaproteobacteria bacterium]|nr:aldehyde dehydrogenase family protein [Gammaproteobacteria bacterium]